MTDVLLNIHNVFRWVVLAAADFALVMAVLSAAGRRPWDALSDRAALVFTITMDVQVLVGIILWILKQSWTGNVNLGFLHPIAMLAAAGLAHVGRARADRAADSPTRGRTAAMFFIGSLVLVLIAIPLYAWPL